MKRFTVTFFLFFSLRILAQDTITYSLEQCISAAIRNNIDVKRSEFQLERSDATLLQSRVSNIPYVSAYASQGINHGKSINPYTNTFLNQQIITGQYGINAGMVLWNGFSNFNAMRQSSFNNKAAEYDLVQSRFDISVAVTLDYLQVLSNQESLKQAASQVAASKAQVDRLELLNKSEAISPDTYHNTKGQLSTDRLNFIGIKAALASSMLDLARLMNIDFPDKVKFEPVNAASPATENTPAPDNIFSKALSSYGALKAAEFRHISALKGLYAARGTLLPTLSLNGSIGTNYSDAAISQKITGVNNTATDSYVLLNNSPVTVYAPQYSFSNSKVSFHDQFKNNLNSYVGLSLQVPLFNSLRGRTRVQLAKIDKEQATALHATVNVSLKLAIEQAHINMTAAFERYNVQQEQAKDFAESFRIATIKFEKGSVTSVDYMIAKSNNDRAAMNLIAAKYDYILKSRILEYYTVQPSR
jgi:outer membrane protein